MDTDVFSYRRSRRERSTAKPRKEQPTTRNRNFTEGRETKNGIPYMRQQRKRDEPEQDGGNFLPPGGFGEAEKWWQKDQRGGAEAQVSFFWGSADLVEWPANTFTVNYRYLPIDTVRYRFGAEPVQKLDTPAR